MDALGSLVGIAVGAGVGFATARYWVKPRKKLVLAYLQALLEELPVQVVIRRRGDGRIVFANRQMAQQFGFENGGLSERSLADVAGSEVEQIVTEGVPRLRLGGAGVEHEFSTRAINGQPSQQMESRQALVSWPGQQDAVACVLTNITPHKRAEAEFQTCLEFERSVFNSANVLFMIVDSEGRIERQNTACERLFGALPESTTAPLLWSRAIAEEQGMLENSFLAAVRDRSHSQGISLMQAKQYPNGAWIAWALRVLGSGLDSPKVLFTGTDQTNNVETEQERAGLEQTLDAVWQNGPEALALLDANTTIMSANAAFLELCGLRERDVQDRLLFSILERPEESGEVARARLREQIEQRKLTRQVQEFEVGGTSQWLELSWGVIDSSHASPLILLSVRNLTERILAERELRETNEFLASATQWAKELAASSEIASAAKNQFLASVSHEIRTPMNGIIGMAELTLLTNLNPEQKEFLETIRGSAESLLGLLNDILDFSKMEAGRMELRPAPFRLREHLDKLLRPLKHRATEKNIALEWEVDADVPDSVRGDSGRLRQILINLVGNSIKFTDEGSVDIRVSLRGGREDRLRLLFVVTDTGIGLDPARTNDVFEPFRQLDASTTRKHGGTGLGVSITDKLVALMGGRLYVASIPGEGSAFGFCVEMEHGPEVALSEEDLIEEDSQAQESHLAKRSYVCLVAEDNPVNQMLVLKMLALAGHSGEIATTGKAAVELAFSRSFDIILMDVQMPEMDGLEATVAIRDRERGTEMHVPILAMTAHAMPGDRERCLRAGMDGYLSKPVRIGDLLRAVNHFAGRLESAFEQDALESQVSDTGRKRMGELDYSAALARVGGDVELLQELAGMFMEEYPKLLDEIRRGLAEQNAAAASNAAHQLKGLLAQFGAETARQAAYGVEQPAREGDLAMTSQNLPVLEAAMRLVQPDLAKMAGSTA